ncbi:MAG: nucleotidyltransferase family protein [Deltaproteobacteria bacterium]|nr:nucleotidyltransferase family protein [Deltaproteobacteria bacterium]
MEAVILAGGFATRLHPLTRDRAKPLLDISGATCLDRLLERLRPLAEHGLTRVVVVTNHRFVRQFEEALSGMELPFRAEVADNGITGEDGKRGAVGDMAFGAGRGAGDEDFWVLAGDNVFEFDLVPVWKEFLAHGRRPLVLLSRVGRIPDASKYNNLELAGDGAILRFVEKPRQPWSRLFAVCVYVFPPDVRRALGEYLAAGENPDNAGSFVAWLAARCSTGTLEPPGAWFDIGSFQELEDARRHFTGPSP